MAKLKEHYANALLELSDKMGNMKSDLQQSEIVHELLDDPDIKAFLEHTQISKDEKFKLIDDAFSNKAPEHLKGFMDLMIQKNKESLILPVLNEYIDSINKRLGKMEAIVVSAKILTSKQLDSIEKILMKQTNMHIELVTKVDPDVIGGFYILINGQIFDGTVRTEMAKMKESLMKGS